MLGEQWAVSSEHVYCLPTTKYGTEQDTTINILHIPHCILQATSHKTQEARGSIFHRGSFNYRFWILIDWWIPSTLERERDSVPLEHRASRMEDGEWSQEFSNSRERRTRNTEHRTRGKEVWTGYIGYRIVNSYTNAYTGRIYNQRGTRNLVVNSLKEEKSCDLRPIRRATLTTLAHKATPHPHFSEANPIHIFFFSLSAK